MKTMGISYFKAHALQIVDEIEKSRESVVITKRGRPIAEVIPFARRETASKPGLLAETLVFEEDIVSPLGEEDWNACR
jgi:prevent-host-death family protein